VLSLKITNRGYYRTSVASLHRFALSCSKLCSTLVLSLRLSLSLVVTMQSCAIPRQMCELSPVEAYCVRCDVIRRDRTNEACSLEFVHSDSTSSRSIGTAFDAVSPRTSRFDSREQVSFSPSALLL